MIEKSTIKKLAKEDAVKAQSLIQFDHSFMSDVKSFFYLFYLGVFNQVDRLDMGVKEVRKRNPLEKKRQEEQAIMTKKDLLKHMLLLVETNRDFQLIVQTCNKNKNELKIENAEIRKLLKKIGWEGEVNTFINMQSPDFLFMYSRLNSFLNSVLTEEYNSLLMDKKEKEECLLTRLQ